MGSHSEARFPRAAALVLAAIVAATASIGADPDQTLVLTPLGTYGTEVFDEGGSEIVKFDHRTKRIWRPSTRSRRSMSPESARR
jgi:hypothetical protein